MAKFDIPSSQLVSHVQPLPDRELNSSTIITLYQKSQITQEEYILLDYLGILNFYREGEIVISFQGLKRRIELHQARLTKALKRLMEKDFLIKVEGGYVLTEEGINLANKLMKKFGWQSTLEREIHSHVAKGKISGTKLDRNQRKKTAELMSGKWFGDFRFVVKAMMDNGDYEIEWISTSGSIGAKLVLTTDNSVLIIISSSKLIQSEFQLQLMMERISSLIENQFDSSIAFYSWDVYENGSKINSSAEIPSKFAS